MVPFNADSVEPIPKTKKTKYLRWRVTPAGIFSYFTLRGSK